MFCSLNSTSRIDSGDLRSIGQHFEKDLHDDFDQETRSKKRRNFESEGLVEADANPITDDESDTETQTQEWPAWESTSETESKVEEDNSNTKWLRNCLIAVSPSMEFVVIAEVQSFVTLERSSKKPDKMELIASIKIEVSDLDYITAVLVLPLASTFRTEASPIDFTCIVVALSSGFVHFYTERGILILREHVADASITSLRFGQSFFPGNQELIALSTNLMYVMEGMSLFSVLKSARNEIARGKRTLEEINNDLAINAHCIQLGSLRKAYDIQLLGIDKPCLFDQHVWATQNINSLRNLASISSHIFCSTSMSFGTFLFYDTEFTNRNLISDTIQHFSSKIVASVPSIGFRSFFGLGQSRKDRPQKEEVVNARRVRINIQSRLVDPTRHSDRSFIAPTSWNLMAICDENARVLLIDTKFRAVLRIWKGYRNARCAFIESIAQSDEKKTTLRRKKVLFLVIFAPKRGILEIWSLRSGPRVAAFNVDPKGRLLTISQPREGILMGQSSANMQGQSPTVVFMTTNGDFKTINVPFHFAALANANRLHDENLMKESNLNELIRIDKAQLEFKSFLHALQSLKTLDCQKRLLERMISLTTLRKLSPENVDEILLRCIEDARPDLRSYLTGLRKIVQIYIELAKDVNKINDVEECNYDTLRDSLLLSIEEYKDLNLGLLIQSKIEPSIPDLLYLGEFRDQLTFIESKNLVLSQQCDRLKFSLHIFSPFFYSNNVEERFNFTLDQLEISKTELLELFILAWKTNWNTRPWLYVSNAVKLLNLILDRFNDEEFAKVAETIEQSIYQSDNPRSALFLLLMARAINHKRKGDQQSEFEVLDDQIAWTLITSRHLSIMSLISELNRDSELGLSRVADKGFGFYREQIGKFVAQTQMKSEHLMALVRDSRTSTESDSYNDMILSAIIRQFPLSFATELLICDCVWECASCWYRNDQQQTRTIEYLELAIEYLSHVSVVARLQHGLSLMIWDTFVRTPFECLYKYVVSNEGRFPRDRLLRKDVFVTEMELPRFTKCIRQLLRILQTAVVDLEIQPKIEHKYEIEIENFFGNRRIKVKKNRHNTLTEVAAAQRSINYHLVLHHIHLTICLELQLLLNLRRPLHQIFPDIALRAFFADLHEHPLIPISDVDERMLQQRQDFMEETVAAVGVQQQEDQNYHDRWELINDLSKDWALDADLLRIKEIIMLHEGNFDVDAEKLYVAVQNRNLLAIRLTNVAMGRFKALIESHEELKSKAPKKLKHTTWNAIRSLPDQFIPNFEPTMDETLSLIKSVICMFTYSTKPSKQHYRQTTNEKRILSELCDFISN